MRLHFNIIESCQREEDGKLSSIYSIIILILWIGFIYAPFDTFATGNNLTFFQEFFYRSYAKFDILQTVAILFLIYCFRLKRFPIRINFLTVFLIASVIFYLLCLLNPNNSLSLIEYLYHYDSFNLLYLLVLAYAIFNIDKDDYIQLYNQIVEIGMYVLLFRCIQSILVYFVGQRLYFNEIYPSSIPQMDILIYISLFQILALIKFLTTKDKLYLLYIIIFLCTLILSYRRSALFLALIADLFLLVYYFKVLSQRKNILKILAGSIGLIFFLYTLFQAFMPDKVDDFIKRYAGAFSYLSKDEVLNENYSDSGHLEQSILTTKIFLAKSGEIFWGAGMGNQPFFVEGQYASDEDVGGIHNSYVLAWATWGIFASIYLLLITSMIIYMLIKFYIAKMDNLLLAGSFIYLSCLLLLGWTNGILFMLHLPYVVTFVITISIVKLKIDI